MPENTTATTELTSQYAAQVTGDLERNIKEQERVGQEITALQEELATLRHDHSVLVNVLQALGVSPAPVPAAAVPDRASVPAPRKKTSDEPVAEKQSRTKKVTGAPADTTPEKPAVKEPSARKPSTKKPGTRTTGKGAVKDAPAKGGLPTLVELVRGHLTEQREPRSAAEVATALGQAHPERNVKATVVRTTLEGLVARNQAQRTKQGTSVFYTTPTAAEQKAPSAEDEARAEQAE
ncbi:hypothetical protein [Streptomyces sp. SID2888]|uniref:hypothetical protein n=1 Tax=Streptomyces sp. SID2888 TaxID=2690256 RepID=UPI001369BBA8|nr:hypothetical protein [Streptomyces sp. SID2888]MYV45803.1 hypothetical protein [Streptomyces sp. SID2888]